MLLLEGQHIGYNHPGILGYMYTFVWNVNEINGKMIATYLGVERPMDAMQAATKFGPLCEFASPRLFDNDYFMLRRVG